MTKTAFITGVTSGFGKAAARRFVKAGWRVIGTGRRADRLQRLVDELGSDRMYAVRFDMGDTEAMAVAIADLPNDFKNIDLLINNAGLALGTAPAQKADLGQWETMIDTNVRGLVTLTHKLLPTLIKHKGAIINISSVAASYPYPGGNVYCATKAAVTALNRGLAIDTLGTGVRVSSVDPGMVETEFSLVRFHGDAKRAIGVYDGLDPLTPSDVAEAVLFCATRPANANVREMILTAGAQASAVHAHRSH